MNTKTMKRTILAVLVALFVCCKEENKDSLVRLTITVPSPVGINFTEAFPESGGPSNVTGHIMRYILEIWDKRANKPIDQQRLMLPLDAPCAVFEVSLPPIECDFLFWADFVADGEGLDLYYDATSLKNVKKLKLGAEYEGDHTRDAFFGAVLGANLALSHYIFPGVILRRPLGRIEAVADDFDKADPSNLPVTAVLTYTTTIPAAFNVAAGTVTGETIPAGESFSRTLDLPASGSEFDVIYDYVFASSDNTTKVSYRVELLNAFAGSVFIRTMFYTAVYPNKRSILKGSYFTVHDDY